MVQAMNTGHDGSLSTIHANGCEDAMRRLETLVLLAGVGLPLDAVRDHLAAAVDLVVHIARDAKGCRRIVEVAEVVAPGGDQASSEGHIEPQPTGMRRQATRSLADAFGVRALPRRCGREPGAGPPPVGWCGR